MRTTIATTAAGLAALAPTPATAQARTGVRPGYTARVTNPWFPLLPGMRWVYAGHEGSSRHAVDVVRVAHRIEVIDGRPCAVVLDWLYHGGRLVERTTDWYTQDARGWVHYEGEDTAVLDRRGHVTSTEGSWRAGRHGARGGVFMPRHPRPGQSFHQEDAPPAALDRFSVVTRHATVRVPYGTFVHRALRTRETTPAEPGVVDRKVYVHGIGQVVEASVRGGHDRLELTAFRRPRGAFTG